jgi:hypothetical protein
MAHPLYIHYITLLVFRKYPAKISTTLSTVLTEVYCVLFSLYMVISDMIIHNLRLPDLYLFIIYLHLLVPFDAA